MDPFKILRGMAPLLCQNGGIRGEEEAVTIASLMRDANKMVSKCIYVNVLKSTDGQDILETFLINGGWDIMYDWLHDARQSENTPLLMEILRVYHILPVTIDIMKKNDAAKTIKQLRKSEDDGIKNLAGGIVDQWMKKIREKSNLDTSNDKSLKKKKKHKEEKVKVEYKEKKDAEYNSYRKREVPSKDGPPQPESMDSEQSVMDNKFINKVPDKAPKEERKRPNTVKSYPSKFRSTGLEEATIILPKKKPSTDPVKLVPKRQLSSGEMRPLDSVLDKKPRLTISNPLNPISVTISPSTVTSSITTTMSSGLVSSPTDLQKIIKTPPKISRQSSVHEIHDSSGFMDALTSSGPTTGLFRRKKKVPPVASKTSQPSGVGQKLPQLPCFYRETLETTEDVKAESESSPSEEKNGDSTNDIEMKEVNEESPSSRDGIGGEQPENSNDSSSAVQAALVRRKPKKSVTWADDGKNDETHLQQIFYFELDETERENVNRPKDFDAMKKEEMLMDRRAVKRLCHDTMKEQMTWQKLLPFEGHMLTENGRNSLEKDIQKQREQGVLQALYFSKHMLPDGPIEPDIEPIEQEEHKVIPLEDEHASVGEEQEYSYDHTQDIVAPMEGLEPGASAGVNLPPELANLMASLQPQIQQPPPPPQDITPIIDHTPSPVVANVQNLLFSLMGNSGNEYGKQDEMTEKLKQILEPLKNQLPGLGGAPMQPPQDYPPEYIDNWHEGPLDCPPRCPNPGLQGMPGPPGPFGPCPPGPGLGPGLGGHGPGPGPGPGFGPGPGIGPGPGCGPGPGGHGPGPGCGPGPGPCQDQGPMRGNRSGRNYPPRNNRSMPQGMRGRQGRNGRDLPKICRHFTSPNGCRYGSNCAFLHPGINGPPL